MSYESKLILKNLINSPKLTFNICPNSNESIEADLFNGPADKGFVQFHCILYITGLLTIISPHSRPGLQSDRDSGSLHGKVEFSPYG
jgi:hypothetical protein